MSLIFSGSPHSACGAKKKGALRAFLFQKRSLTCLCLLVKVSISRKISHFPDCKDKTWTRSILLRVHSHPCTHSLTHSLTHLLLRLCKKHATQKAGTSSQSRAVGSQLCPRLARPTFFTNSTEKTVEKVDQPTLSTDCLIAEKNLRSPFDCLKVVQVLKKVGWTQFAPNFMGKMVEKVGATVA